MRTLLSFAIVLFIFSNSFCEDCSGLNPTKKEDCIGLTVVEDKDRCCFTEMGTKEKGNPQNIFRCLSFFESELANKEDLLKDPTKNYVDIDCDLSGSSEEGANSGNSGGEKERNSNSSSKLIYLSKAIFILLLLVL